MNRDRFWLLAKVALLLVLSSYIFSTSCTTMATRDVKDGLPAFKTVLNSPAALIFPIIRLKTPEDRFYCTGYVIDGEYAITAAHCIVNKYGNLKTEKIKIADVNDKDTGVEADAVALDRRSDLGLIQGDFRNFKYIEIDPYSMSMFATPNLISCGFPYGQKVMLCVRIKATSNYYFQVQGQGTLYPGMSGGPVIDVLKNMAVGVNSAVIQNGIIVSPLTGILSNFRIERQ